MSRAQIVEADLTWTGAGFERGVRVEIDAAGRFGAVGALDAAPTLRLRDAALLPGMVNAHSHAFQRGLRGRGETFPSGRGSFWTWRESMYGLVERMDARLMHELSRQAFEEMLDAGITTVGEFHYLHHEASGEGFELDDVVREAARDAGIRLVLLGACYRTGGIGAPLAGGQRRFACASLEAYWQQMDATAAGLDAAREHVGAVAHSIRAVPLEELIELRAEARRRGWVLHMHVEEQPAEIEACIAAYGATPMALLNERVGVDGSLTAVHCTHTRVEDMRRFAGAGGIVCLCPLTEASLGDGLADVPGMREAGATICLGTDSNARISMTEEMRWLELGQRLGAERRGICVDETGDVARPLWAMATEHGARALGLDAGRIEAGLLADLVVVDLAAPALAGWDEGSLLAALVLGTGSEAIGRVCVGGRWVR